MRADSIKIFISYARAKKQFAQELEVQLKGLKHRADLKMPVDYWYDNRLEGGQEWWPEIEVQLQTAHIVILLLTPEFIASSMCAQKELGISAGRYAANTVRVIPIVFESCQWTETKFTETQALGMLQCLPNDAKPIDLWPNRAEVLNQVTNGLVEIIKKLCDELDNRDIMKRIALINDALENGDEVEALRKLMVYVEDFAATDRKLKYKNEATAIAYKINAAKKKFADNPDLMQDRIDEQILPMLELIDKISLGEENAGKAA